METAYNNKLTRTRLLCCESDMGDERAADSLPPRFDHITAFAAGEALKKKDWMREFDEPPK